MRATDNSFTITNVTIKVICYKLISECLYILPIDLVFATLVALYPAPVRWSLGRSEFRTIWRI